MLNCGRLSSFSTCSLWLQKAMRKHTLHGALRNGVRTASTESPIKNNDPFLLEKLKGRSLIRVSGPQSREFLQSLITNDINHLPSSAADENPPDGPDETPAPKHSLSLYTMFLNKAGRVLYDAIVYKPLANEETYLVECDRQIDTELQTHLKIFRVRKKIDIDIISNERSVWVAFQPKLLKDNLSSGCLNRQLFGDDVLVSTDPRLAQLGSRIIAPQESAISDLISDVRFVDAPEDEHQFHRYRLGIGEGVTELPVTKCFPLESNCDYLHGVSFHKGCYLGQEFTARTHHTGVVRKRLLPVEFSHGRLTSKSSRHVETTHGTVLGKVRGFQLNLGLALLKFETALLEESDLLFGGADDEGVTGRAIRPYWWPQEAPKR